MASIMFEQTKVRSGGGASTKKKKTATRKVTPKSVEAKMKGEKPTEPTLVMAKRTKKKK
jgi:hypothetical protein